MQYAIVQGVESENGDSVHLFVADSREHDVELFLNVSEFMPSESEAEILAGVLTPRLHVTVGPRTEVEAFDRQVREIIQRLFGLIASEREAELVRELEEFDTSLTRHQQAPSDFVLSMMIRATFPGPDEMRYPCSTVYEGEFHKDVGQGVWAFWTTSDPEEEIERKSQVQRLLGAWWEQYRLNDGGKSA